jgi:MFS family permease
MKRDIRLVVLSMFIWGIGEGMFMYFQPLALEHRGAGPLLIGAVLGLNGIVIALAQIPSGLLTDRIGARPMMWFSWGIGVVGAFIMAISPSMIIFIIGMLVYGLSSFVLAPMNSYIIQSEGGWSIQRKFTTVSAAYNLGAVIGPLAGGWIGEKYSISTIYMISVIVFIISTSVIFLIKPQYTHTLAKLNNQGAIPFYRNPRFIVLLVLLFLTFFAQYLPQPLAPNYLQDMHKISLSKIGQLGAIGSLGNAILALTFGGLNALTGFMIGQVLIGAFAFLLWRGDQWIWFALGYFCLGGYRLSRSMVLALVSPLARPSEIGALFGIIETANAVAVILSPLLAGYLYSQSPNWIFASALFLIAFTLILNYCVMSRSFLENIASPKSVFQENNV